MGRLDGCVAYLCGPIDHADDDGVGWRRELTTELSDRYGVKVLDPTDKPFKSHTHNYEEIGEEKVNGKRKNFRMVRCDYCYNLFIISCYEYRC